MNLMIDEIQEKLYEFEQNKKNNLIFHGILADHPETSDGYGARLLALKYSIHKSKFFLLVLCIISTQLSI